MLTGRAHDEAAVVDQSNQLGEHAISHNTSISWQVEFIPTIVTLSPGRTKSTSASYTNAVTACGVSPSGMRFGDS
jgi:hypothetical protein